MLPGRGVWVPAKVVHSLRITGQVAARTLFVDPLARADLPAQCLVVQVSPLLRELIICAMEIAPDYPSGGREERVMELILDELRMLPILPLHLPEPREASLLALCRHIQATLAQLDAGTGGRSSQRQRTHPVAALPARNRAAF